MKKLLLTCCACLFLVACGPRIIYPYLGWLIPWYVDDYISLDTAQNDVLSQRLALQLDWHCRTQLHRYAEFLRRVKAQFDSSPPYVSTEVLREYNQALISFWQELMARIGPDIADIIITASDDQISELFANLETRNRELEQKFVESPSEMILRNREDRTRKRIKYWIGKLTSEQLTVVSEWNTQLEPFAAAWLAHRREVQASLKKLLQKRTVSDGFKDRFIMLLSDPQDLRSDAYQDTIEWNTRLTLELIASLDRLLTDRQRGHLSKRLENLARDFEYLSCDPTKRLPPKKQGISTVSKGNA